MSSRDKNIRTRIAPSPTGPLHIGTARTALFNYLFAKKHNGGFVLRIEDTDQMRSKPEFESDIIESLHWLGVEWDEGPDSGGVYAPYRQSERREHYRVYIEKLLRNGHAFYCFHSPNALEREKKAQIEANMPQRHICTHFDKKPQDGVNLGDAVIRFRPPTGRIVEFTDLIRGKIEFDITLLGDFSIAKSRDLALYNFAAVVDDHEMEITHVIRGEDHISNTPKQILIQQALGFFQPFYAHLPLILGEDRAKLSKRDGALSVSWYRNEGYLPEALINYLALLGWNPGNERELFSRDELVREFSLERIQKGGAVFSITRLDWMNGGYIRKMDIDVLTERCTPFLNEKLKMKNLKPPAPPKLKRGEQSKIKKYEVIETGEIVDFEYIKKIVVLEQERLKKLSQIGELASLFFRDMVEYKKELLFWKNMSDGDVKESLEHTEKILYDILEDKWNKEYLLSQLLAEAEKVGDRGRLFWPFRVALSGRKASPDPIDIAVVLGKEKTLKRVREAIKKL